MNCSLRLRPLLKMTTPLPPDQVIQRLREARPEVDHAITCSITGNYIILRINEARRHFGSPQLSFDVQPCDNGSVLSGIFMPMPSIWTAFMGLYCLIGFGGFCAAGYGYAQSQLEHTPSALLGVPVALVLLLGVHLAACLGQHRGQDQINELRLFVETALT